jgi:WD40 repeat protein
MPGDVHSLTMLERVPAKMEGHAGYVYSVAFSPDGKSIVSGSRDDTVRICGAPNVTNFIRGIIRGSGSR